MPSFTNIFPFLTTITINSYPFSTFILENSGLFSQLKDLELLNHSRTRKKSHDMVISSRYSAPYCPQLIKLTLHNVFLSDHSICSLFENCAILTHLSISKCLYLQCIRIPISIEHMEVQKCIQLRALVVSSPSCLQQLSVINCPLFRGLFCDALVESNASPTAPSLVTCNVSGTGMDSAAVEMLLAGCPRLRELTAERCRRLGGHLSVLSPALQSLSLQLCNNLTALTLRTHGLTHLRIQLCSSLAALSVEASRLSALDASLLRNLVLVHLRCERLTWLDLSGCTALFQRELVAATLASLGAEWTATDGHSFLRDLARHSPRLDWSVFSLRGLRGSHLADALDGSSFLRDSDTAGRGGRSRRASL